MAEERHLLGFIIGGTFILLSVFEILLGKTISYKWFMSTHVVSKNNPEDHISFYFAVGIHITLGIIFLIIALYKMIF